MWRKLSKFKEDTTSKAQGLFCNKAGIKGINLAIAVQRVVTAFAPLYNAKIIEPKEFIRLVYRFVGETIPATIGPFSPINLRGGSSKLPNTSPGDPPPDPTADPINP